MIPSGLANSSRLIQMLLGLRLLSAQFSNYKSFPIQSFWLFPGIEILVLVCRVLSCHTAE